MFSSFAICLVILATFEFLFCGVSADQISELMSKFQQNKYRLRQERFDVVRYDKTVYRMMESRTFKYNRTQAAFNLTFQLNINPGNEFTARFQVYKFMSNEYRYFPIELQLPYCALINENLLGLGHSNRCGNFTGCPLRKNQIYHVCNWVFDDTQAPPLVPDGRYMLEFQVKWHDKEVSLMRGYGEISTPIKWAN